MYRIVKLDLASDPPRRIVTQFVARDFTTLLTEGHKHLEEKENYFITHYECNANLDLIKGDKIFFDIDGIDKNSIDQYIEVFIEAVGVQKEHVTILDSGNGLHIILQLIESFDDPEYFNKNRVYYKYICDKVQSQIEKSGLSGSLDTLVFSPRKFVRLPETTNFKPKKHADPKKVKLISLGISPYPQSLKELSGYQHPESSDFINPVMLEHLNMDSEGIIAGCEFLKWAKAHPRDVSEPQWYASLSILGRLKDGEKLCHEYSEGHPSYSESETNRKISQAINTAGPRKCDNINSIWGKCNTCPHHGKISSPILIKGEEFLSTENTGFRNMKVGKDGQVKKGGVNYEEFGKHFARKYNHVTLPSKSIFIKETTHYREFKDVFIEQYIQKTVDGPLNNDVRECKGQVSRLNVIDDVQLNPSSYLNLQNGILALDEMKLYLRTELPDMFFTYTTDYEFDPEAKCPLFLEKVEEIFEGNPEGTIELFKQFIGASIYGVPNKKLQRIMLLFGKGGNGKSLLLDVVRHILTEGMTSAIPLSGYSEPNSSIRLLGKRLNVCDETPKIRDFDTIKRAVSGELIEGKLLYKDRIEFYCNTKTVVATNKIPDFLESNDAMKRRFIIIPLMKSFVGKEDMSLHEKLQAEKSGILNWFIEGAKAFIASNYILPIPSKIKGIVDETVDDVFDENSKEGIAYGFINSCVNFSEDNFSSISDIYEAFMAWCSSNNISRYSTPSNIGFSRAMSKYAREELSILNSRTKFNDVRGYKCAIRGTDENTTAMF